MQPACVTVNRRWSCCRIAGGVVAAIEFFEVKCYYRVSVVWILYGIFCTHIRIADFSRDEVEYGLNEINTIFGLSG